MQCGVHIYTQVYRCKYTLHTNCMFTIIRNTPSYWRDHFKAGEMELSFVIFIITCSNFSFWKHLSWPECSLHFVSLHFFILQLKSVIVQHQFHFFSALQSLSYSPNTYREPPSSLKSQSRSDMHATLTNIPWLCNVITEYFIKGMHCFIRGFKTFAYQCI